MDPVNDNTTKVFADKIKSDELPKKGWLNRVDTKLVKKVSLVSLGVLSLGTLAAVGSFFLSPGVTGSAAVGSASFLAVASDKATISTTVAKVGAQAARILGTCGRYLFYAFAVPTYGAGYALPQWLGNTALPHVAAKVAGLAPYIQTAANWMGQYIGEPLVHTVSQVSSSLVKHVALPAFRALNRLAVALGPKIERMAAAIQPLVRRGAEALVRVATPVFRVMGKALAWAGPKVGNGIVWSFKHVIIPGAEKLAGLIENSVAIANNIGSRLASVILKVQKTVLKPFFKNIVTPAWQMSRAGFNKAAIAIHQASVEAATTFHRLMSTVKAVFA